MSGEAIRPLVHTGDLANLAYYREKGTSEADRGYVWVESMHSRPLRPEHTYPPRFHVRVYRQGEGVIGEFTHTPKAKPRGRLAARTITALVRDFLADPSREAGTP